jgi:hypothetical protein
MNNTYRGKSSDTSHHVPTKVPLFLSAFVAKDWQSYGFMLSMGLRHASGFTWESVAGILDEPYSQLASLRQSSRTRPAMQST